jgi:hypothetical protein
MAGLWLPLGLGWSEAVAAELTISEKGQSRYTIVLPKEAIPAERYAAEELQRYMERMSGAKLAIVTDDAAPGSHEIWLGDNAHLRAGLPGSSGAEPQSSATPGQDRPKAIDFAALGRDGFTLRTAGNHLLIAGGRPRGTLNGVYVLLEEKWGVRWFAPEVEVVPKRQILSLPLLDETKVPALEYREVFWTEMMRDGDFAARHRLNGPHHRLQEKHGGAAVVYYPFVHSFDALIPQDSFKEHPEYFPLINGQRKGGYVQRCLTNPDVVRLAIDQVRQWIRDHPEANIFSVSQNDTGNNCQCENCRTLDEAEGSPAGSLLRFVNAIAEAIEKDHPNVRIDTLAYQYTRKPPKTIRPRPNVIVRLCSIECCFAHALADCPSPENRRFRDDIIAWQPVAQRLYVWDYTPNFAHYLQPFPNFDALQPNVQFFVKHGVSGLFEQGNYSSGGCGEMGPLRAYLLAKLLWNPETDLARHREEFLSGYYGKAAPKIQAYLDLVHSPVREQGVHAHIYDPPQAAYLTDPVVAGGAQLLDEAERMADNDAVRFRVQVARLPVWYVQLATGRVKDGARLELLRRFVEIARRAGITDIREGGSLAEWAKKQGLE